MGHHIEKMVHQLGLPSGAMMNREDLELAITQENTNSDHAKYPTSNIPIHVHTKHQFKLIYFMN